MRFWVERTYAERILVEADNDEKALDKALDYSNNHNWAEEPTKYTIQRKVDM